MTYPFQVWYLTKTDKLLATGGFKEEYKLYTDSLGRNTWYSPEDFEIVRRYLICEMPDCAGWKLENIPYISWKERHYDLLP